MVKVSFNGHGRNAGLYPERRKRSRARLGWQVTLHSDSNPNPIAATLQNISSNGFYCVLTGKLCLHETLKCVIQLPGPESRRKVLDAVAEVVRIEPLGEDTLGIACRVIEWKRIHVAD